ncbi:putative phage repressor [Desulfarculus baarsii DSM 2075]|uniref:Phage repressor n=1 Tax=Desulfarculus baarsii (strain ATCC 33931 / DSM 2075 / LMG 7858 / VKM B-1802 / 2st14) TaxID=644282 RepID=E1QDG7_DESB2|nr:LexA family transcriptional regulator [Desulfarculus baarsii]ADK83486.1 putative phage repressor [Desulfarculus baarsii DSM 2075]
MSNNSSIRNNRVEIGGRFREIRKQLGLSQQEFASVLGVTQATASRIERGEVSATVEALSGLLCAYPDLDVGYILCGNTSAIQSPCPDALEVAANICPVIRTMNSDLSDVQQENVADDYLAVPLLEGKAAAGAGGVTWNQVKSLVWVYKPELGQRRNCVALRVWGDSMEPTIPDGSIVIVDLDQREPDGRGEHVWALRTEDGDTIIKRLRQTPQGVWVIISDNSMSYGPSIVWTGDFHRLVIGRVIWMWRALP